jgi:hypothetical protein
LFLGKPIVPVRNPVNEVLLKYALKYIPDRIIEKEGVCYLDTVYNLTTPYPLAEYNSLKKYGDNLELPINPYWDLAWVMVSNAFKCMDGSPLLDYDDSFRWLDRTKSPGWPWQLSYPNRGALVDSDVYRHYYVFF